jgi:2,3-bisphosphoglycerate-independent phosphoglycerate mutase
MKYAIVIMDGAADEPLAELSGQTVLEKAHIPHTDSISRQGRQGLVRTVPAGFAPGSDVALMSVMGYDPKKYYTGRAPLEAAAKDISVEPSDWIFRCNLVTVADGLMVDHSAGHIDSVQSAKLIADLNEQLGNEQITFYAGVGYRHLMVIRGNQKFNGDIAPPHDFMDEPIAKYLPKGKGSKQLRKIMEAAAAILDGHEVNKVRNDLGENQATNIWLWGQGHRPQLDSFRGLFGISGSVITAVDLMRGIAKLAGMRIIEVEGATGYLDTDYEGKGQTAIDALADVDLVLVHVEAPDEAGHGALVAGKIEAIEQIDKLVVGPLLKRLQQEAQWRIMVLPDHPTPIRLRTHTEQPVPFALAGTGVTSVQRLPYSEPNSDKSGFRIERGHELMEYFLQSKG